MSVYEKLRINGNGLKKPKLDKDQPVLPPFMYHHSSIADNLQLIWLVRPHGCNAKLKQKEEQTNSFHTYSRSDLSDIPSSSNPRVLPKFST